MLIIYSIFYKSLCGEDLYIIHSNEFNNISTILKNNKTICYDHKCFEIVGYELITIITNNKENCHAHCDLHDDIYDDIESLSISKNYKCYCEYKKFIHKNIANCFNDEINNNIYNMIHKYYSLNHPIII